MTPRARQRALVAATILALAYSIVRFVASGVLLPLSSPAMGQVVEEIVPLVEHLRTGEPVHIENPRQYGPVFFFVMDPLLRATGPDEEGLEALALYGRMNRESAALTRSLYAIQLVAVGASFLLTLATFKRWLPALMAPHGKLAVLWLAILWLNFVPMYYIVAVKNVETWELLFISIALYAYLRGWLWLTGVAIAAGGLTKLLPFVFVYYLLLRNRVAAAYSCAAVAGILLIGHAMYGPDMGVRYLPDRVSAMLGPSTTWALAWHENVSLKGMIAKLFGYPDEHFVLVLTDRGRTLAAVYGTAAQVLGGLWLTWALVRRRGPFAPEEILWEWSLVAVSMMILSPQTAFEYTTLALGAMSYAFVRVMFGGARWGTTLLFAAAALLLGVIVPRSILNQITFAEAINRWTGYTHLRPSEAYQYYGFPLIGLLLLLAAVWQLRPASSPEYEVGASPQTIR